jgi:pimeloyl-ACP methyl ester carboxylesterase
MSVGAAFSPGTVDADGFTIRYERAGEGDAVVVLHGAGGPQPSAALDALAEQFDVIALEIPGFGDEVNDRTQTLDDLAATIAAAAEALGLERYHLLGTSFGGATALHVGFRFPERVASMVLEAPVLLRDGAKPPPTLSPDELQRAFRVHPDREPPWQPPDPEAMGRRWPLVERVLGTGELDEELVKRLEQCEVRTLVLFGTEDGIIPSDNGRSYRQHMPNCALVYVYDAAHDVQGDRAEAFADLVGDFLRRGMVFLVPEESTLINA